MHESSTAQAAILFLIFGSAVVVLNIVCWCQMAKRLGYDALAGLLMLIPLVNFIVFLCWAFAESPNEKKIRALKKPVSLTTRDDEEVRFLAAMEHSDVSPPPAAP